MLNASCFPIGRGKGEGGKGDISIGWAHSNDTRVRKTQVITVDMQDTKVMPACKQVFSVINPP